MGAKHKQQAETQLDASNADEHRALYTPAAGHHWLTPFYDFGVATLTREHRWRSALIAQVRPRTSDVIVDVGCGTGSLLSRLGKAAPSARLIGIDPDPTVLARARKKVEAAGLSEPSLIGASWVKLLPRLCDRSHGSLASLRGRRLAAA